jgi:hypothetical protein
MLLIEKGLIKKLIQEHRSTGAQESDKLRNRKSRMRLIHLVVFHLERPAQMILRQILMEAASHSLRIGRGLSHEDSDYPCHPSICNDHLS